MKPIHKFNGGKGATLCHNCRVIIVEKLTDKLYCKKCKENKMEVNTRSEEVYPVYYENDDYREWAIKQTIDVDPRLWIDYKIARDKFLKLKAKLEHEIHNDKRHTP